MTSERVMLLIDADNVSVDVMEQAVAHLLQQHGALHVRRAYGTAESAVKHQAVFKRLAIKPMVNLSAGKNSTDIALAVDALDLVLAERPDVVAVASSDSDFAPLVSRLREKGCRVVGYGQDGKTGDDTLQVYDAFTVLAHRKAPAARKAAAKAATKAPAKTAARKRKAEPAPPPPPPPPEPPQHPILGLLPELREGQTLALRVVSARLRAAGLLGRSASSARLLGQHADLFELLPPGQPNHVRLKTPA